MSLRQKIRRGDGPERRHPHQVATAQSALWGHRHRRRVAHLERRRRQEQQIDEPHRGHDDGWDDEGRSPSVHQQQGGQRRRDEAAHLVVRGPQAHHRSALVCAELACHRFDVSRPPGRLKQPVDVEREAEDPGCRARGERERRRGAAQHPKADQPPRADPIARPSRGELPRRVGDQVRGVDRAEDATSQPEAIVEGRPGDGEVLPRQVIDGVRAPAQRERHPPRTSFERGRGQRRLRSARAFTGLRRARRGAVGVRGGEAQHRQQHQNAGQQGSHASRSTKKKTGLQLP